MTDILEVELETIDAHQSVLNQLRDNTGDDNDLEGSSRDRHSSVQSLTILASRLHDSKTLMDLAVSKPKLRIFFSLTGNCWPKYGWFILARSIFVVNRMAILAFVGLLSSVIILTLKCCYKYFNEQTFQYFIIQMVLYFVLILGALSVLPAQYFNRMRLFVPAEIEDFMVVDVCLQITYYYGALSSVCIYVGAVLQCVYTNNQTDFIYVTICVASSFVVLSLMFNMFFLLLDLRVSLVLLDQLHVLADKKMLTFDKFNMVRKEIQRRVKASRLACDFIIIPSLASIVGISISLLVINQAYEYEQEYGDGKYSNYVIVRNVGIILVQLKELFFICVAFIYVAKVNGRADELTIKLSQGFWGNYTKPNNTALHSSEVDDPVESVQLIDLHRVSMHMSSISQPISFTLLFKRVSYENVIISSVSFGITILVSILKNFAFSSVN